MEKHNNQPGKKTSIVVRKTSLNKNNQINNNEGNSNNHKHEVNNKELYNLQNNKTGEKKKLFDPKKIIIKTSNFNPNKDDEVNEALGEKKSMSSQNEVNDGIPNNKLKINLNKNNSGNKNFNPNKDDEVNKAHGEKKSMNSQNEVNDGIASNKLKINVNKNLGINSNAENKIKNKPQNDKTEEEKKLSKEEEEKRIQKRNEMKRINNEVREKLKCHICFGKVMNPLMCKYCQKIGCEKCVKQWLSIKNYCNNCRKQVTINDMISVPFFDDFSNYFINNMENDETRVVTNIKELINKQQINNNNNKAEKYCSIHSNTEANYFCCQCNKNYCNHCLMFQSEEAQKHSSHSLLKIDDIEKFGLTEAKEEYAKLQGIDSELNKLISLCSVKLKGIELRKIQRDNTLQFIQNYFDGLIYEDTRKITEIYQTLLKEKEKLDVAQINVPTAFVNVINRNDFQQGKNIYQDLQNLNSNINLKNYENVINSQKNVNDNYAIQTFESEPIILLIPSIEIVGESDLLKQNIKIIPNQSSEIIIKYFENNIYITVTVQLANDNKDKYSGYILISNKKYGLEYTNLEQNLSGNGIQILSVELPANQFFYMKNDENKITINVIITKYSIYLNNK